MEAFGGRNGPNYRAPGEFSRNLPKIEKKSQTFSGSYKEELRSHPDGGESCRIGPGLRFYVGPVRAVHPLCKYAVS
jgi:hypothetical protein